MDYTARKERKKVSKRLKKARQQEAQPDAFLNKKQYSILLRIVSACLIHAFLVSSFAWAAPITSNPKYSLARWTHTEDPAVNREMYAAMYRESKFVWGIKPASRHDDTLKKLCARGFLLRD